MNIQKGKQKLTPEPLTWAPAIQMRLMTVDTDAIASGGLSAGNAGCKDGRTS